MKSVIRRKSNIVRRIENGSVEPHSLFAEFTTRNPRSVNHALFMQVCRNLLYYSHDQIAR